MKKISSRFNSGTPLPPFILPPSVLNASLPNNDMPQDMQTSITEIKIEKDDVINTENQNILSNQTEEINTKAPKLREKQKRIIIDDDIEIDHEIDNFLDSINNETTTDKDKEETETSDSDVEHKSEFDLYVGKKCEVKVSSLYREEKVTEIRDKVAIDLPDKHSAIKRLSVSRYHMNGDTLYADHYQSIEDAAIYAYTHTLQLLPSLAGQFTINTIYKICTLEIEPLNKWIYRFTSTDTINTSDSLPGFKRYYEYYLPLRAKLRREGYIVPVPGTIDTDPYINKRILKTFEAKNSSVPDECIGVVIGYLLPETREKDGQEGATLQGIWYRVYYLDDGQSEDLEAHELDPLIERYKSLDASRVRLIHSIFVYYMYAVNCIIY